MRPRADAMTPDREDEAGREETDPEPALDLGAGEQEHQTESLLTLANAISVSRVLALIPLIYFAATGRHLAIAVVLAWIGISDYLDGVVARHMRHVSKIGKVLDPICDRIALGGAIIVLLITGDIPLILGIVLMVREVIVSGGVIALGMAGWPPLIKPTWAGKSATLLLMFAIPMFVVSQSGLGTARFARLLAWGFAIPGVFLYYYAMFQYAAKAWSLRDQRKSRSQRRAEAAA